MATVTVIIPTIPPRDQMLKRALLSVYAQTRKPDDVAVFVDHQARGAAVTRNRCLETAATDYVATLDDDDEFMPHHLEVLMACAEETDADVVYSWFEHEGWPDWTPQRPDPLAVMYNGRLVHPIGVPFGEEQAAHMRRYAFIPITALIRTELFRDLGGWPTPGTPDWPRMDCEDWGGWLRLLDGGAKFVHVPERTWILHHGTGTAGRPWK